MTYTNRRSIFAAVVTAAAALCAGRVAAQTVTNTWTAVASGIWSNAANWDANGSPVSGATTVVQFNNFGSTAYTATQDIGNPLQLNGLIFNSNSATTTITNNAADTSSLSFQANGAIGPFLFQNNAASVTISGSSGTAGTITFAASPTFGGGGTGAVTISAPVVFGAAATGLALNGYNTTTLSNATSGGDINLPSGGLTITGNGIGNVTFSGVVTGTPSSVVINTGSNNYSTGIVTLSGASTYTASGGVSLQSGTLVVSNATGLGNAANVLTISGGELRVSATVANPISMSGVNLVYPGTSTGTLTGVISVTGTSGLQILGTGGLTINNTAGFNGTTVVGVPGIVTGGTLTIGSTATTTGSLLNTTGITVSTASNSGTSGSLVLTNATADATRLSSSTPITLNSARLSYVSSSTLSNALSLGAVTVNGFGGIGTQNAATDTNATALTFNSLTLANNATIGFRGEIGTGTGYTGTVTFTNGVNGPSFTALAPAGSSTPAVLPWAVGNYTTSGNTTNFSSLVTTSGANGIRVLNPASASDFSIIPNAGSFVAGANNFYPSTNAGNPAALAANTTLQVNSLVLADTNIPVLAGGQGSVFQVFSGALVNTGGARVFIPTIDFGSNTGYIYNSARFFTFNSFTGSAGLVVSGYAGSPVTAGVYLGAQNPFTGGLTINGAALVQFASDAALGATGGPITFGGGSLDFLGNGAYALTRPVILTPAGGTLEPTGQNGNPVLMTLNSGQVSGTGPLVLNGSGTLALAGTASGTWSTVVTSGILQFLSPSNFGSGPIVLNGGTLQPTVSGTLNLPLQVNASSTIDVGSQTATYTGTISTIGYTGTVPTLTKAGVGSLTVTGISPYTGAITVSAGTLTLSGSGQLANTTAETVNAGATFTLDNTTANNNTRCGSGPVTLAGGSFNLLGNAAGTSESIGTLSSTTVGSFLTLAPASGSSVQLTAAGLNVPAAGTLVIRGTALGTTGANTAQVFLNSAPVRVNGIIQGVFGDNDPVNGGGSFLVTYSSTNGIVAASLTGAGGNIQNPGTATTTNVLASGATTVTGATNTVNSLTLAAGTSLTSSGGTLTLTTGMLVSQSGAASSIDPNTTIASASGLALTIATAGTNNLTINGPLTSASGALVKLGAGTLTLAATTTTFTGAITAGAGTLEVPLSTTTTAAGISGNNGTVSADGTLMLTGSGTFFGTLAGGGSVLRPSTASGTQILAGPITLTGGLESDAGTLQLQSNVPAAATSIIIGGNGSTASAGLNLAPGITVSRNLDFQAGGSRSLGSSVSVANQAAVTLAGTATVESGVTLLIAQNNSVYNVTGQIAGIGTIALGSSSTSGGGTLNLPNANNSFSGQISLIGSPTTVSLNTVLGIGSSSSLGSGSLVIVGQGGSTLAGGGYLQALNPGLTIANSITTSSTGSIGAVLGLVGTNPLTLSSVDTTATGNLVIDNHSSNGSVLTITTLMGNNVGGAANVSIGFPTNTQTTVNNLYAVMPITNIVSVGTLQNGGSTTVNQGVLQITGTATSTDNGGNPVNGPITVARYGTLAGTGTINRNTEIAGTIAPGLGGASGTLTFNNPMFWDAGGKYAFAYSAITGVSAGVNYNTIIGTQTLDLTGVTTVNPFTINITPFVNGVSGGGSVTYTLGSFSGGINGFSAADFAFSGTFSGTPSVSLDATQDLLLLTFTPVTVTAWTWTGNTSGSWNTGSNWSPTFVPSSNLNIQLTFGSTPNPAMTNDIPGTLTLNLMTFNAGSPVYTLGGNGLNFVTNGSGALPQIVSYSGNSVTISSALTLTNNLTVNGTGNVTLNGAIGGAGSLTMAGSGILTLSNTANAFTGGVNFVAGTVAIPADGALGTGPLTFSTAGTLAYSATTATIRSFALNGGTLATNSGVTLTVNGGTVTNGFLDGAGTFSTNGALFDNVTATPSVIIVSNSAADQFVHFTNSAALSVAAGVNTTGASTTTNLNGFTNEGLGTVTVGAAIRINVANFQSFGTVTLNPAVVGNTNNQFTLITNTGAAALSFNGGSRTFLGTPATANSGGNPTFVAGIDLHGQNLVVTDGLFVNNGFVVDLSGGTPGNIIVDYGALYKGAGYTGVPVITQNGGKVQAGNSPGSASFGRFVFGPGGVSNYVFAIDDATGTAGPSPDAAGHVSGWGLVKAIQQSVGSVTSSGDFTWTATPTDKLTVAIDTLVNPTMVGTDVAGLMADFDPTRAYSWPAAHWAGTYSGPTDAATLNAATSFDTSAFLNPTAGTFGWSLDPAGQTLSLIYTPSAVPEPGTLVLVGAAAALVGGWRRRSVMVSST